MFKPQLSSNIPSASYYPIKKSGQDQLVLCTQPVGFQAPICWELSGTSADWRRSGSQPSSDSDAFLEFDEIFLIRTQQTCSYTALAFGRGETEDRCSQALVALPALPLETSRLECSGRKSQRWMVYLYSLSTRVLRILYSMM